MKKYLFLLLIPFFIHCKQSQQSSSIAQDTVSAVLSGPQIILLNFIFKYDSIQHTKQVSLKKISLLEGETKESRYSVQHTPQHILLSFLNPEKETLKKIVIKDPLIEYIEYVNQTNQLERKKIEHKEAEISILLNYTADIHSVVFEFINEDLSLTPISTITIKK